MHGKGKVPSLNSEEGRNPEAADIHYIFTGVTSIAGGASSHHMTC